MESRRSGSSAGDGASSTTFWWRRWIEHSRSKRWMTLPPLSPITCTSTCRGSSMSFSRNTDASPKAASASRLAPRTASAKSCGRVTTRIPRPPPPALAFTRTGKPLLGPVLPIVAGDGRHAGLLRYLLRPGFQADGVHRLRRRPDPDRSRGLDRTGKGGALGQEAVPRVDRLGAGGFYRPDDPLDVQVALGGGGRAYGESLVGEAAVHRVLVDLRVDRDRGDAQLAAGQDQAHRYLAAVRDQELAEAQRSLQLGSRF